MSESQPFVDVSAVDILISVAPLAVIACISNMLGLDIESPMIVSVIRAFVQLSILTIILDPIFLRGVDMWWLVVGYCFLMILLASYEGSTRSKYYIDGQFWMVLFPMMLNVVAVALFAFCVVIKPEPRWGMLHRIGRKKRVYGIVPLNKQLMTWFCLSYAHVTSHKTCKLSVLSAFYNLPTCSSQILNM